MDKRSGIAKELAPSVDDPISDVIRRLAGETTHGIYLYRALDEDPTFCSYDELYRRVAGCMERFRAEEVGSGTRVLLPFDTSIEVVAALLALIGLGALTFSVKPLDARSGKDARAYLTMLCQRHRITHAVLRPESDALSPSVRSLDPSNVFARAMTFASARKTDVAFVQFSSGSTSSPKGVPITRGALARHLDILVTFDERTQEDVYVSWLPLYHDMGLVLGLLTSVYARNDLHLSSPFQFIRNPTGWLDLLSQRRATHTATPYFGVSYCLDHFGDKLGDEGLAWNFEALRSFLIGSDPTDVDRTYAFQERLSRYGFKRAALLPAYGMAEAVLVVTATQLLDEPRAHTLPDGRKLISTGRLLPGFEARVTREDGSACDDGELGQIELRGGTMAEGYFEDDTPFYNGDGYFETGDLAYRIKDELIIAGRAGDRIKVNGQTLFSNDFEFAAQAVPFVKPGRVVVFQIEDRIIVLAQLASEASALTTSDVQHEISQAMARRLGVKVPAENIHFIAPGQIEKTTSGKLRRRSIAQSFLAGRIKMAARSALSSAARIVETVGSQSKLVQGGSLEQQSTD
jgi:acyl-CoA synthetase (AMP-forming)/AMP-acid ligase II